MIGGGDPSLPDNVSPNDPFFTTDGGDPGECQEVCEDDEWGQHGGSYICGQPVYRDEKCEEHWLEGATEEEARIAELEDENDRLRKHIRLQDLLIAKVQSQIADAVTGVEQLIGGFTK